MQTGTFNVGISHPFPFAVFYGLLVYLTVYGTVPLCLIVVLGHETICLLHHECNTFVPLLKNLVFEYMYTNGHIHCPLPLLLCSSRQN